MSTFIAPFAKQIDASSGAVLDPVEVTERRLSDMEGFYADPGAYRDLAPRDPVIYRVYEGTDRPPAEGDLRFSTTVIEPGAVGREYFMTKGHFHAKRDRAEVYVGLGGAGLLLLESPDGEVESVEMRSGTSAYVPPHWAHRSVNTGDEPFAFLAVYPADAGYDYGTIAERGFASIVVERGGAPTLVPNPRRAAGQR